MRRPLIFIAIAGLILLQSALASATQKPPVRVSIVPPASLPVAGQNITLTVELTSKVVGTVDNVGFSSEFANIEDPLSAYWSVLGHTGTGSIALSPDVAVPIDVTLNCRIPEEPIQINFQFGGHWIRQKVFLLPLAANELWGTPVLSKLDVGASSQRDLSLAIPGLPENRRTDIRNLSLECDPRRNPGKIPALRVRGKVVYFRPDGIEVGADAVTVRVYDQDTGSDDYLGGQVTDAWGNFDMDFVWAQAEAPDIYIQVAVESGQSDVVHPNIWEEVYVFTSGTHWNFSGSDMNWGDVFPSNMEFYPALHIQTTATRGWRELNSIGYGGISDVNIWWPDDTDIPYYVGSWDAIHMNEERQWWEYSLLHEYGHHFNDEYGSNDWDDYCNTGDYADDGDDCGHTAWCPEDEGVAWNEGIAEFVGNSFVNQITNDWGPTTGTRDHEDIEGCAEGGGFIGDLFKTEGVFTAFCLDIADGSQDTDDDALANGSDKLNFGIKSVLDIVDFYEPVTPQGFWDAFVIEYPSFTQKLWFTAANNGYNFDTSPPPAVTGFSSTSHITTGDEPDGTVDLIWNLDSDPQSGIWNYRVEIADNAGFAGATAYSVPLGTSWTAPALVPNTYWFRIKARNNADMLSSNYSLFGPVTIRAYSPPDADVVIGFWDYPIIPRQTTGSTLGSAPLPGFLLGNVQSTYYNYHIGNSGEQDMPQTIRLKFWVDGALTSDHPVIGLDAFDQQAFVDIGPDLVRGGRHTLTVFGDATELVSEPDETDNFYHRQFVWSPLGFSGTSWQSRSNPPDPWGGFDSVGIFDSPNCDGFQYSLQSNQFRGVVSVPLAVEDDDDLRLFDVSLGSTNGYSTFGILASSSRPAGCVDAVFTNNSLTATDAFQVGVYDFDDEWNFGFDIRRIESTALTSGVSGFVQIADGDYLEIFHVSLAGDGYPDYGTLELIADPADGLVHAAIIDPTDTHFGLDDASFEGVTDESGILKLEFVYGSPMHGIVIWQDPKDVPAAKKGSTLTTVLTVGPKRADMIPTVPAGWYDAVVPTTGAPGTLASVQIPLSLTGNTANTYFNAAVRNEGQTAAGAQDKLVYLDGIGIVGSQIGQMGPFTNHLSNYATAFSVQGGRHTVSLRADDTQSVTEDDESNNRLGRQYIWSPFQLTITNGWRNRSAPPLADGGWTDLFATAGFNEPAYFNCDGVKTPVPVINGNDGYWVAVSTLPQGSSDVDLRLHDETGGLYTDFGAILEASGWPGTAGDYVLANFRDTPVRQFDVGIVRVAGADNYYLNYAASDYLDANPTGSYGPFTMGSKVGLQLHEMWLDPGTVIARVENVSGSVDWGMTLHRANLPYQSKSTGENVSAWTEEGGFAERIVFDVPEAGYYCLSVWRARLDSSSSGSYQLSFDSVTGAPPSSVPVATRLHGAMPNPFNPRTSIGFDLASPELVELAVYDIRGARIRTLARESLPAGRHERIWSGVDDANRRVASGVYFVSLRAGHHRETRKLTLVK